MAAMKHCAKNQEHGVALIMVIFMIVLCSALLISLSDSTYTAMRVNRITEQRVKAEYILKSAINFARVLIQKDGTDFDDPTQDDWMQFQDGREVPGELVGVNEPNVKISLLISPENAKIPLLKIIDVSGPDPVWRDVVFKLFQGLGFDNEPTSPDNASAEPPVPFYTSAEMVGNLIDYLDQDSDSYSSGQFQGMESNLPQGSEFPNTTRVDSLQSTLLAIPGFTPLKVQQLLPYISVQDKGATAKINIGSASVQVLSALIEGLDPSFNSATASAEAEKLIQCRDPASGGPYNSNLSSQITQCAPNAPPTLSSKLIAQTTIFSVIAKVEYGNASFFASAFLKTKNNNKLPEITEFLVY